MQLEQLFSDREKEQLNSFVNNETMKEAVRKVILSAIYFDGTIHKNGIVDPTTNFALILASMDLGIDDEKLGKQMKISLAGVQLMEKGFKRLERFDKKKQKQEEERSNPAR